MGDIPVHRRHLLPYLEEYAREWAGEERFFVNPRTGHPWSYDAWRDQVERDVLAAGLEYGREHPRGVTAHTLRHTIASWMAQADVQLMKIAMHLRDSVATASKYYAHLLPSDLEETINALE